jgi:hypothetical protein
VPLFSKPVGLSQVFLPDFQPFVIFSLRERIGQHPVGKAGPGITTKFPTGRQQLQNKSRIIRSTVRTEKTC